jgi:ribonuclease E
LLELSRQRFNPSLTEAQFEKCSHCHGAGYVRTVDSASILALRALEEEGIRGRATQIFLSMPNTVALYILNNKRDRLIEIEKRYGFEVFVRADDSLAPTGFHLEPIKGEVTRSEDDEDHSGDEYSSLHSDHDADEQYSEQPQQQSNSRARQTRQNNDRPRSGQNSGRDSGRGGRGQNRNQEQQQYNEMPNEIVEQPSAPAQAVVETTSPAKAPPKDTGFKAKRFSSRKPKSETPKNETPNTEVTDVTNIVSAPQASMSQPAKANDDHEYGSSSEASQSGSKKKGWWNKLID